MELFENEKFENYNYFEKYIENNIKYIKERYLTLYNTKMNNKLLSLRKYINLCENCVGDEICLNENDVKIINIKKEIL